MAECPGTVRLTAIGERAAIRALRLAPKQLYSTLVDWGARRRVPRALRRPLYSTYSHLVGANLREVELPLTDYDSFGDFFVRRLRTGAREATTDLTALASPCDGKVGSVGAVEDDTLLAAKGRSYKLSELLVSQSLASRFEGGTQLTIYLSPADYHRVHAPVSGRLVSYTYVPGARYPVGQFFVERVDNLFCENERLVLELETDEASGDRLAIVLVGAMGVGNLYLKDPPLLSRELAGTTSPMRVELETPLPVARGQELGAFRLGSTVILALMPGSFESRDTTVGQRVECGQAIGRLRSAGFASQPAGWPAQ